MTDQPTNRQTNRLIKGSYTPNNELFEELNSIVLVNKNVDIKDTMLDTKDTILDNKDTMIDTIDTMDDVIKER